MINLLTEFLQTICKFISSANFVLILLFFIVFSHLILFFIRDKNYISALENIKAFKPLSLQDFDNLPTVNIIVPAWKEGEIFNGCLLQISKLSYPNLKVIVNAGGSDETINIAESFKKNTNFSVIYQKTGQGKIKAINDCLRHVSEGIVYLIDADIYLDDDIFFHMLNSILNDNQKIAISMIKPHNSIRNRDLVKYVLINRNPWFLRKYSKYAKFISQNTIISYDVIKNVSKFTEGRLADDGYVMGSDIRKKGYQIFVISNSMVESYNYPLEVKDYLNQNLRWLGNFLFTTFKENKLRFAKFLGLTFISIYIYISPLLIFLNPNTFYVGMALIFSMYLKKLRKILFLITTNGKTSLNLNPKFYIKLLFYIYFDLLMNIIVSFEMLFYRKGYKKRKNLLKIE